MRLRVGGSRQHGVIVGLALFVLAAGWAFVRPEPMLQNRLDLSPVPAEIGRYYGEDVVLEGVPIEDQLAAQAVLYRDYYEGARSEPLNLCLVYNYARRSNSFHDPHVCFPAQGYTLQDKGTYPLDIGGQQIRANLLGAEKNATSWLVVYWYLSDKKALDVSGKRQGDFWDAVKTRLQRRLGVSTMVRVTAPVSTSEQETMSRIQSFLNQIYPRILQVRADIAQPPMPATSMWVSGPGGKALLLALLGVPLALVAAGLAALRPSA